MSQESEKLKKLIKETLDENFGPLLLKMAKMIRDMSDDLKSLENSNLTQNSNLEAIITNQENIKSNFNNFSLLLDQFDKLDKNLARFLQKSVQDSKKIQEQIEILGKGIQSAPKLVEEPVPQEIFKPQENIKQVEITNLISDLDSQEIKNLIAEFSKRDIYTTEALRLIEETRDRLLFEREDEVPYRAFAAKIFREILGIIKQEKDFRLISAPAAQEVKKHLSYLQEHM